MSFYTDENAPIRYTGTIPKTTPTDFLMQPTINHLPRDFDSVVNLINEGTRVCVILRGLPGSGKSLLAHELLKKTVPGCDPKNHIFSADHFFMTNRGYQFVPERIGEAHEAAQKRFAEHASKGFSPIIADNTHMARWETHFYAKAANCYNYKLVIMEPETPWLAYDSALAKKNQHNVPSDKIKMMRRKYEKIFSAEDLLNEIQQVPCKPLPRNFPPPPAPKTIQPQSDLMTFEEEKLPETKKEIQTPILSNLTQVFEDQWDGMKVELEKVEVKKIEPLPQRKLSENKQNKSNQENKVELVPHRKNCPNENERFCTIRELYCDVNDVYLWDLFTKCEGDADWCVNLLVDSKLSEPMNPGNSLSCDCSNQKKLTEQRVTKMKVEETKEQQSPVVKTKKSKPIDLDEWLLTKKTIEESITIGKEHFPEHVNMVKKWKQVQVEAEPAIKSRSDSPNSAENITEELHALSIPEKLILELDQEYGDGLLADIMKEVPFPEKIFIRKSVAHQLYLEIMEACNSHLEESRLNTELMQMKEDEKLAMKLNEEFNGVVTKPQWIAEESTGDDLAVRLSKEKLFQLFPDLPQDTLMIIFESNGFKFDETVDSIQDSLGYSKKDREKIKKARKEIFNTPWKQQPQKKEESVTLKKVSAPNTDAGYTDEHLKTVEALRQEILDHREEQTICRNRAQEAIQKKQYELATYFSNIARFHKLRAEEASHIVANLVSNIHENTQSSARILDLHYLRLEEADTLLETFLDRNIIRIREIKKPYEDLFIITGRGKNSMNGVPAIKNSTKVKLRRRNLKFDETNPGMLSCKIYNTSKITVELEAEQ